MSRELASAIDAIEHGLVLVSFDRDDAWWLGSWIRSEGLRLGAALSIEIRNGDLVVFNHLMTGASRNNAEWMRRKIAVAARFERSSLAVGLAHQGIEGWFERAGLVSTEFSPTGGAVPIRVVGSGVVGSMGVSGLSQEEDHDLAVAALRALKIEQTDPGVAPASKTGRS